MAEARAHYAEFKNLPPYSGPGIATKARKTIALLTEFAKEESVGAVDPRVKACSPTGCVLNDIRPHGSAYWSKTAAISATQNGESRRFFIKLTRGNVGLTNLTGELNSIKTICKAVPGLAPVPIAVGSYAKDSDTHFYLAKYVNMTNDIPRADQLAPKIAELHAKAVSPNGKFGFSVPTCMGACVQPNGWTSSWEKCFSQLISHMFAFEQEVHGEDPRMLKMHQILLDSVIPRLLRPLETDGRSIQPRFLHADLWDGNATVDVDTNQPVIFDASGFYGHNEFELGPWNLARHRIYRPYIEEYCKHFPPSQPAEDFEDRLVLYRYRFNLTASSVYLDNMRFRSLVIEDLEYLTTKYAKGYQGSWPRKPEEAVGGRSVGHGGNTETGQGLPLEVR